MRVIQDSSVGQHNECMVLQARINTAETAQKKLELQLSELQPHAAKLEESLNNSQARLKAATIELASVRADLSQTKVCAEESLPETVLCHVSTWAACAL